MKTFVLMIYSWCLVSAVMALLVSLVALVAGNPNEAGEKALTIALVLTAVAGILHKDTRP
jgi:hypothetical protein